MPEEASPQGKTIKTDPSTWTRKYIASHTSPEELLEARSPAPESSSGLLNVFVQHANPVNDKCVRLLIEQGYLLAKIARAPGLNEAGAQEIYRIVSESSGTVHGVTGRLNVAWILSDLARRDFHPTPELLNYAVSQIIEAGSLDESMLGYFSIVINSPKTSPDQLRALWPIVKDNYRKTDEISKHPNIPDEIEAEVIVFYEDTARALQLVEKTDLSDEGYATLASFSGDLEDDSVFWALLRNVTQERLPTLLKGWADNYPESLINTIDSLPFPPGVTMDEKAWSVLLKVGSPSVRNAAIRALRTHSGARQSITKKPLSQ